VRLLLLELGHIDQRDRAHECRFNYSTGSSVLTARAIFLNFSSVPVARVLVSGVGRSVERSGDSLRKGVGNENKL
jgi:hypothetical protein